MQQEYEKALYQLELESMQTLLVLIDFKQIKKDERHLCKNHATLT